MRNIAIILLCLGLVGCTTTGNLQTIITQPLSTKVKTVSINYRVGLPYLTPWRPDLRDLLVQHMAEVFKRYGYHVVDQKADLAVVIQDIQANNCTVNFPISDVKVVGSIGEKEILQSEYSQHSECFTFKGLFFPSKEVNQVAALLVKDIVRKLK